ncbi:hypothetical protein H0H92_015866 [Tricholoma furcatifolium]|nr:hypothetical protein H0H92_015866 [Tricholoma furcatifolium]
MQFKLSRKEHKPLPSSQNSTMKAEDNVKPEPEYVPEPPITMSQKAIDARRYNQDVPDALERYYIMTVGLRIGVFMT